MRRACGVSPSTPINPLGIGSNGWCQHGKKRGGFSNAEGAQDEMIWGEDILLQEL